MRNRRTLVGALVLIALVLITLDFRQTGGPVGSAQQAADGVFAPIQNGFAAITRPIGNFFGSILEVGTLRSRVDALETDNQLLRLDLQVQADLERRLAEAEGLLNMAEQQQVQLVGARVIASPPGSFERQIVLDVGAAQGVAPEMAVINERGVVGLVVEVTGTRARVNLLSSTEGRLSVRVAESGDRGTLVGQGSGLLQLTMIDSDPQVPLDATIVTQVFQGSLVPSGLPVGVLETPPDGDPQGERFLEVRPFVDFSALSTVAVVVAGREDSEEFGEGELIAPQLVDPPTVDIGPDQDEPTIPGVDLPGTSPSPDPSGTPTATASPTDGQ
ncbi:rod shape-determining protein MreC [Euzebya tangerina]|uniref:rod shape-determining protein MreC n=1 Tax=Euzebya tangerina TaxID=591198 RepID=UPI000E3156AD|nr:rod shape-determining protein MreC [Euzebya tangerina]